MIGDALDAAGHPDEPGDTLDREASASGQFARQFTTAIVELRAAPRGRPPAPFSALRSIISTQAQIDWTLAPLDQGFRLNVPQSRLEISEELSGRLYAHVVMRVMQHRDQCIRDAVSKLRQSGVIAEAFVGNLFVKLFLAHEWVHQEQRLSSFQYKDSDTYPESVSAVDYQADVGSVEFVFSIIEPSSHRLTERQLISLLITIHIAAMQFFTPSATSGALSLPYFRRLLVWHFQLARIAASRGRIDLRHPSFATEPIIEFPRMSGLMGPKIERGTIQSGLNSGQDARQDIVVAIRDSGDLSRIVRLSSTDDHRTKHLMLALIDEDSCAVREQFQELFDDRPEILEISPSTKPDRLRLILNLLIDLAGAILARAEGSSVVSFKDSDVVEFFDRLELLLRHPLPGEGWEEFQSAFEDGGIRGMQARAKAELGDQWRSARNAKRLSGYLGSEVARIRIRLQWSADELT